LQLYVIILSLELLKMDLYSFFQYGMKKILEIG